MACPGGPRTFRRDRDGGYADVSVVSNYSEFSLFVLVGAVDGEARRGFEFVPLEMQCGGDTCEAVTWGLFVPRSVYQSRSEYQEALRWGFQLPGKWAAEAAKAQAGGGRSQPQPTVENVPPYPPALDAFANARICVQAAPGVSGEAVDRVIEGLVRAVAAEPRYGSVRVESGCPGGYAEPGAKESYDGLLAKVLLPTKAQSDALGLAKPNSLGYLREPLNADSCAEKCATSPARLHLIFESFDAPDDLDGDRAGLVTGLRNALFGLN